MSNRITTAKVECIVCYPDQRCLAIGTVIDGETQYIPLGPDCGLHIFGTTINAIDLIRWIRMTPNVKVGFGYANSKSTLIAQAVFTSDGQ